MCDPERKEEEKPLSGQRVIWVTNRNQLKAVNQVVCKNGISLSNAIKMTRGVHHLNKGKMGHRNQGNEETLPKEKDPYL